MALGIKNGTILMLTFRNKGFEVGPNFILRNSSD